MSEPTIIDRPPRIQPELPVDEIEIPGPPEKEERGWERLIQVGLPLLTIIGYALVSGRSPRMMIPMALSVVGSVLFSIYSYFKEKKRRAEQEKAYSDRITELTKEMAQHHDQQRRFYRYNYPDVQANNEGADEGGFTPAGRAKEHSVPALHVDHQRQLFSAVRIIKQANDGMDRMFLPGKVLYPAPIASQPTIDVGIE